MLWALIKGALVSILTWVIWQLVRPLVIKSSLDNLPGPRPQSFWQGNLPQLFDRHGWTIQDDIDKQGRAVVRITGLFNRPALYVFDPKALQHIVIKDLPVYERSEVIAALNRLFFGNGILSVLGDRHHLQRKMLNPVFSINHMRHMAPIFYQMAHRLHDAIVGDLESSGTSEVDMLDWMGRMALELIGQGGLGYSFDPLVASTQNSFGEAIKALLPTLGRCAHYIMLVPQLVKIGPASLRRRIVESFPDPNVRAMRKIVDTMEARAKEILEDKRAALRAGDEALMQQIGEGKDIMSILSESNMSADSKDRLTEEELVAQMSTLVFAATDTTSNALARTLDLLSTHLDVQEKLREEILEAGHGEDIPYDQLVDNLPYLDAVCRETLRLHPPASLAARETLKDVSLPFSEPIQGLDGTMIDEVVVPKGTMVFVGIRSANRNKAIWGEDALEWKPERWLSPMPHAVKEAKIPGVYMNLMTFLGGSYSCIGFKFSQLEMKVVLAVLLSNFKFFRTNKEIYWNVAGVSYPSVGPDSVKPAMPLIVQRLA